MSTSEALLDQPAEAALAAPEKMLQRLLGFESVGRPVISVYLDARVDQHGQRNFLPFVRKRMTERGRTYETHTPARESFEEDFVRIVRYLEDGVRKDAQGIAIFSCSGANDFFEVAQFAVPFPRNRIFVYDRPHVYPLARLSDEYRRYAVVLADTNRAQIFVFASGRAVEQQGIENVKTKHTKIGGWSQARYQRHEENYHLHHVKEVVDVLARTVREEAIENIILAGDEQTVIPLLREQMPKALADKVVDVLSLGIDTPAHEVLQESLTAFQRFDALSDMQKVEQLLNEYRADDLGAAGVVETLAALSNGQVEEMLIAATAANLEYDEAEVKKVLAAYTVEGVVPVEIDARVVADELVRRAKELSSARVTFIEDASLLEPVGGVGALLRYRISEDSAVPYEQGGVTPKSEALTRTEG
jgi:peptide chain release factor subunit 1